MSGPVLPIKIPPKKATPGQYKELVNLVKKSDVIRWGKGTPDMKKEAWEQVAEILNAIGGAQKNGEGWKKAFIEWKSHIKAKIRSNKILTDTEKECAESTGLMVASTGITNVPELGLGKKTEYFQVDIDGTLEAIDPDVPGSSGLETQGLDLGIDPEVTLVEPELASPPVTKPQSPQIKNKKKKGSVLGASKSSRFHERTTVEQFEMYINSKKKKKYDGDFSDLCSELNKEKCGPKRTVAQWKQVFSKWEKKVKAKARRIHFEQEITGGGIPIVEILTNLEKKLLEVLSKILIFGHPQVVELGFSKRKIKIPYKISNLTRKKRLWKKTQSPEFDFPTYLIKNIKMLENSMHCIKDSFDFLSKAMEKFSDSVRPK